VPCRTEHVLPQMTSSRSTSGFKRRCPGEPSDYRRSPGTATDRNPECQKWQAVDRLRQLRSVVLNRPNGSASPGTAIVQNLKEQRSRYIEPAATKIRSRAVDIGVTSVDISERDAQLEVEVKFGNKEPIMSLLILPGVVDPLVLEWKPARCPELTLSWTN